MEKKIIVGCCGFPVSQKKYYEEFNCVEINSTFYQIPQLKIATKWKKESQEKNPNFEFIIKAWQIITHNYTSFTYYRLKEKIGDIKNCGFFKNTKEVFTAWERTKEFAVELGAKKILFQCPGSFLPNEENLKNIYQFFNKIKLDRGKHKFDFIIELRNEVWDKKIILKVCRDLDLIHCVDPLYSDSFYGRYRYYRLHGLHIGNKLNYNYKFSKEELKKVLEKCDRKQNYILFNNLTMYKDSLSFKYLINGAKL